MPPGVVDRVSTRKPPFTRDQIVAASDVVRHWRAKVEPKLQQHAYVLVFSGADPRTAVMPYDKFEGLWQRAEEAAELEVKVEVLSRLLQTALSGESLTSLAEVVERAGITPEEMAEVGDVEIEAD